MSNPSLTERDLVVLVALSDDPADADTLARRTDVPRDELDGRLAVLADNGLVREANGSYALTDSGRRVIRAPSNGTADDSLDVPDDVRETLRARGLRADRLDAVLGAFAFLSYWGTATGAEIADGVFSEVPLDCATATDWWTFVRDHLAAVPTVDPPSDAGGFWRFTGRPGAADGRDRLFDRGDADRPAASATEAMVAAGLADGERRAVAAALAVLQGGEETGAGTLRSAIRGELDADSADVERLLDALARLPGVVRSGERWRYTLTPEGYESDGYE